MSPFTDTHQQGRRRRGPTVLLVAASLIIGMAVAILAPQLPTTRTSARAATTSSTAPSTSFTCGMLGLSGDGLSGDSSGDYSISVADPATIVLSNSNVFPSWVIVTPNGSPPISVRVPGMSLRTWQPGIRTVTLPSPGDTKTPYVHTGTISGVAMMDGEGNSTLQVIGFIESPLCNFQRRIDTVQQVAGTGVMPATGDGSISFRVHLSAPVPPRVPGYNDDPFVVSMWQTNSSNSSCGTVTRTFTMNPGDTDTTVNFPVPAGTPAGPVYYRLFGPQNHLPYDNVAVGTIAATSPPTAPVPPVPAAPVLRSLSRTTSSATLAWTPSPGARGYRVYEGSNVVARTTAPTTTATVGALLSNTTHSYVVRAFNDTGPSSPSNTITLSTLPTYRWRVNSQTVRDGTGHDVDLDNLRPGQRATVSLNITNTGSASWRNSGSNPIRLGTSRPNDRPSLLTAPGWLSVSRPAAIASASVPPGGSTIVTFPIQAADIAGTWTEQFDLVAEGIEWFSGAAASITYSIKPLVGIAAAPGGGYWLAGWDGGVFAYGGAPFFGSMGGQHLNAAMVGMAATPSGNGYWLVGADGGVFAYGDAGFYGSMAGHSLNAPIVGMAATPSGNGYWLVGADGGVFAYGDAVFAGSMAGQPLNRPIVGIAAGADSGGYRLVGADGGVFAYGDAPFLGSMGGQPLNAAVVGIASTSDAAGYWLVGADGGIYAYGDAGFGGSLGGTGSPHPVVGVTRTAAGYDIADTAGTVTTYAATPPPPPPPPPPPAAPTPTLAPGAQLNPGDALTSPDGEYRLVMQNDGNLVEYDGGTAVWASNTSAPGSVLINQNDGNIAIVAPGNHPVWATGTTQPGSVLTIQDDRNVVVYAPGNVAVWATNTGAAVGLHNQANSRCLDADLNTIGANATVVQLWDCNGQAQQLWYPGPNGSLRSTINGRCLDADLNTIGANGTRVQLWDCNGQPQQSWVHNADGTITNTASGRCLDADLNTIGANGTRVQLWDCNSQPQQTWR